MWSRLKRFGRAVLGRPALVVSLSVTGLLLFDRTGIPNLVRPTNLLEPLELSSYDRLIQLRPALPPDPRLLVVKVTEADIQSYGFPLKDAVLNELLGKLEQYQPAVIGLDIYRDIPVEPGHAELSKRLQSSDRIIPVCKISDVDNPGTPPPSGVPESRVGFSDMAVDNNGVVRRGLLFGFPPRTSRCTSQLSFSFQLAQHYLEQKGIQAEKTQQQYLKLGKVLFKPLLPTDGGYQDGDNGGYQILLNYRTPNTTDHPLAQSATLSDILSNRIDPSLVKDHIVMIGVTAPSIDDAFYTPYSSGQQRIQKMAGVVVHGQIVSQLLSTVLDGRPQLWFSPDWGEVLWIWVWSLTGGILVRIVRHPGQLVLAEGVALSLLLGTSVVVFLASGWLPVAAPTLGLIAAGTGVLGYSLYEAQLLSYRAEEERRKAEEERQRIEEKAKEQEKNIEDLQALLKERSYNPPTTERESPLTEQTELPAEGDTAIATPQDFQESQIGKGESNGNPHILDGRYKISRILGSGGFGQTYLAQDNHRPGAPLCVVKHLKPARRDVKFLQVARRLFKTEAEILEKLGQHPQIPQLLAYFEQTQEFYLVQEYIQGHPLSDELPTDKRLPEIQVIKLLKGVLEILIFIHQHSVIHRDIKPSNIMRELDGQLVLIDFGAVKQIQPQEQADKEGFTVAIGTRGYAPPEQYAGHPSFSSDIYALGMIGIQALTGIATHQLPFSSETGELSWRHLANVSEEFAQILDKMVRYHFAARYQSAAAVMEALQQIMN